MSKDLLSLTVRNIQRTVIAVDQGPVHMLCDQNNIVRYDTRVSVIKKGLSVTALCDLAF
jgi:hypothetical protein